MPYYAQRLGPNGEIIDESIPTPEEQAAIDAANASVVTGAGGGNAPVPPPASASAADPFAGVTASAEVGPALGPPPQPDYIPESSASYQYTEPVPAPAQTSTYTPSYPSSSDSYAYPIPALDGGNPNDPTQAISTAFLPNSTQTAGPPTLPANRYDPLSSAYVPPPEKAAPLQHPNPLGGVGPLGPEYINAKSVGGMGDLGSGARWAPPVPPPPEPASNWWDPIGNAIGGVLGGWLPAVQQESLDNLNQGLGINQPDTGVDWNAVLSPEGWPVFQEPRKYYDSTGREMMGVGDIGFMPGEVGGIGTSGIKNVFLPGMEAGVADDVARAGTVADDAARVARGGVKWESSPTGIPEPPAATLTSEMVDDAARVRTTSAPATERVGFSAREMPDGTVRVVNNDTGEMLPEVYHTRPEAFEAIRRMRTTAAGEAIPEPPTGKPLAEPEPVVGTEAGATTVAPPAAGAPRGRSLPRITKGRLAAGAAAGLVGVGLANNVIRTGQTPDGPSDIQRPPLEPGIYSPSTNPSTKSDWENASTRSLQLMAAYSPQDWSGGIEEAPIQDAAGAWRSGLRVKGVTDEHGLPLWVGYADANGNQVPVGSDVTGGTFRAMLASAAPADPPIGSPDEGTPSPSAGIALEDISIPVPAGSESQNWNSDWSDGSSSGRGASSHSSDASDQGFTASDFWAAAHGNRAMAERMAAIANHRRKKRMGSFGTNDGMFWQGFPLVPRPSPIREHVLAAIQESIAQSRNR